MFHVIIWPSALWYFILRYGICLTNARKYKQGNPKVSFSRIIQRQRCQVMLIMSTTRYNYTCAKYLYFSNLCYKVL